MAKISIDIFLKAISQICYDHPSCKNCPLYGTRYDGENDWHTGCLRDDLDNPKSRWKVKNAVLKQIKQI